MMLFIKGEILSETTAFETPLVLEMAWSGSSIADA
jgi:hypothetical protein